MTAPLELWDHLRAEKFESTHDLLVRDRVRVEQAEHEVAAGGDDQEQQGRQIVGQHSRFSSCPTCPASGLHACGVSPLVAAAALRAYYALLQDRIRSIYTYAPQRFTGRVDAEARRAHEREVANHEDRGGDDQSLACHVLLRVPAPGRTCSVGGKQNSDGEK